MKNAHNFSNMIHKFENDFQDNVLDIAARRVSNKHEKTFAITDKITTTITRNDDNDEANGRSKMFSYGFQIYKRREIVQSVQNFKCGQKTECFVTFIESTENFYVQKKSRIEHLNEFESCIQNYANVLLNDYKLESNLYSFQNNVAQSDVVLVKSNITKKWQRAIFLGKLFVLIYFLIVINLYVILIFNLQ